MPEIKINDIPRDSEISRKEMKSVLGGEGLSETEMLNLQMTMDRRSKYLSTLSNIMKKISSTQDSIIQNLK